MNSASGNKVLEINEDVISIKSATGSLEEIIKLDEVEKLILKETYSIPQETMKEVGEELMGSTKQNFLIFQQNDIQRRIDFGVDSYYMIEQLNQLIANWESRGFKIERIPHE